MNPATSNRERSPVLTQPSTWVPASAPVGHPLHRDDVPDNINAVIIDNVLNGSDVNGSGRRLARAMLPISGAMCTSSFRLSLTTNYRLMLTSVGTSSPTCPPACHLRRVTDLSRWNVSIHVSWQHQGRSYRSPQLQKRTPADISAGQAFSGPYIKPADE